MAAGAQPLWAGELARVARVRRMDRRQQQLGFAPTVIAPKPPDRGTLAAGLMAVPRVGEKAESPLRITHGSD